MKELKFKFADFNLEIDCEKCEKVLFLNGVDYNLEIRIRDIYLSNLEVLDFKDIIAVRNKTIFVRDFKYFDFKYFKEKLKENRLCSDFKQYLEGKSDQLFGGCTCYIHYFWFFSFMKEQLHNFIQENKGLPSDWKQFLIDCLKKIQKFYEEWALEKEENVKKIIELCKKEYLKHKI